MSDFYNEEYMENAELLYPPKDYDLVKKASISCFEKPEYPEEKIQRAVSCTLDPAGFPSSLRGMDSFFKKAGFDENSKLGFLWKAVMENFELSQLVMYWNPPENTLKASVLSFLDQGGLFCWIVGVSRSER